MNWIKRTERLPEMGQGVLLAFNTGVITIGYRRKPHKKEKGYSDWYEWQLLGELDKSLGLSQGDYVTHWMPLPEPPKG